MAIASVPDEFSPVYGGAARLGKASFSNIMHHAMPSAVDPRNPHGLCWFCAALSMLAADVAHAFNGKLKAEVMMSHSRRIVCAAFAALLACSLATCVNGQEENAQTIEGWGTITDLLGDCAVKADRQKLSVRVPGGTHDLNRDVGGLSAPRILQSVDGDFVIEVKVTSDFEPGRESAAAQTRPFNSAGLLVWQDEKNYIRLERNRWWAEEGNDYACYPPLIEHFRDGVFQESNPRPTWASFFEGKSTWLRLEREGEVVTASCSQDGEKWTRAKRLKTDLAKQLQVGVMVVNTSTKELAVEFDGLKITSKPKTEAERAEGERQTRLEAEAK